MIACGKVHVTIDSTLRDAQKVLSASVEVGQVLHKGNNVFLESVSKKNLESFEGV